MADQQVVEAPVEDYTQLSQARVPMSEAAEVFSTKDAEGRTPIVVLVQRARPISNPLIATALVVLAIGLVLWIWRNNMVVGIASIIIALGLVGFAIYRSFSVMVSEGANALLSARGKYIKTLAPGYYTLSPFVRVSHLVTRREIPFEVPVTEAPARDNVRISLGALITFSITEPFKFVYNLSASDFDRVFQAACQNVMRTMIRGVSASEVNDLPGRDTSDLRATLSTAVAAYGVEVQKISITSARPPADFLVSQEARELAIVQEVEQRERQALAQRLQADQEVLARQAVIAQVARETEIIQGSIQAAENRKRLVELEAEVERLRLEKLEERLMAFPIAAQWEVETAQLDIARGLASNTHAVVQVGNVGDIPKAFAFADVLKNAGTQGSDRTPHASNSNASPDQSANIES